MSTKHDTDPMGAGMVGRTTQPMNVVPAPSQGSASAPEPPARRNTLPLHLAAPPAEEPPAAPSSERERKSESRGGEGDGAEESSSATKLPSVSPRPALKQQEIRAIFDDLARSMGEPMGRQIAPPSEIALYAEPRAVHAKSKTPVLEPAIVVRPSVLEPALPASPSEGTTTGVTMAAPTAPKVKARLGSTTVPTARVLRKRAKSTGLAVLAGVAAAAVLFIVVLRGSTKSKPAVTSASTASATAVIPVAPREPHPVPLAPPTGTVATAPSSNASAAPAEAAPKTPKQELKISPPSSDAPIAVPPSEAHARLPRPSASPAQPSAARPPQPPSDDSESFRENLK